MRHADEVTFGGSGLDRAQAERATPERLAKLLETGRVLPLWRGNPLFGADGLAWVSAGHPVLAGTTPDLFLGLHDGQALFAADISTWQPPEGVPAPAGPFAAATQVHPALPDTQAFCDLRSRMAGLSPLEAELAATAKALFDWHRSHRFCSACGAPSVLALGGWQRRCPSCNAQHFPRTDPVVIMLVTRGNRVLLGRSPGWPEGMYSLLAGFMEPGETVEAAVRREVSEECGVRCGAVRYLASQPWPFPASLMLGCHAVAETEDIHLDPTEIEAALWVSREDMVAVLAGQHPVIRPPRKGAIAAFLLANWLADRLD